MLYYIIYIVLALLCLTELIIVPKRTKNGIFLTLIILFIVLGGLRWNTGADWRPYSRFFTRYDADDPFFMAAMEPGFALLVRFLRLFSNQFTFYLIILSLACISLKAVFFHRYTSALFLALILFWGTALSDIIAVRQTLAVSICALSCICIVERKPILFTIIVLIASQIHITSCIFLLAYKVYYLEWSVKSKYICLILAMIFGLTIGSEQLLEAAISVIPEGFGLQRLTQKAETYMAMGNEISANENVSKLQRTIAAVAKRAILLPVFFAFQNRFKKESTTYGGFLNLYTFGNVLYFLVIDFLTLQRMATYFYFFEIIIFCIIFEKCKSKSTWLLIILTYALLKLVSLLLSGSNLLIPYIWIFSKDTFRFMY